jgi:hypothetical protein
VAALGAAGVELAGAQAAKIWIVTNTAAMKAKYFD